MPDLSMRYNPTGEAQVTLVDTETGEPVPDFPWMTVVLPRDTDLLVQLRTTDETLGEEITTLPLIDTVGAREQALVALQAKAVEYGHEVIGVRLGDEQEEPLP